ncbi:uncharacterized protein LOC129772975 [Toxorhynchites rutilus septentrionalis]|uniref:uncharacterized protein LOC129772975 n=1 Tax=Toxorhynchites rutilus septentrionalis TaxID=329112 RepID=UPI002478D976|nr:uncharacterized protein LOC129772975 [Toxorhynchites rutilus septentrionalis]
MSNRLSHHSPPISGIGQSTVNVHYGITLSLSSRFDTFSTSLECLVLPKLTVSLPGHHIDVVRWNIPRNLPLADPQFNISKGIDIIIGAELFYHLLEHQQFSLGLGYPILQKTFLGYIVCGKLEQLSSEPPITQTSMICAEQQLDAQLQRFWEVENIEDVKEHSNEEQACEEHFLQTTSREVDGRFVVRLPLREDMITLMGDSYQPALRRFLAMERKLASNEKLRREYLSFMEDYEKLGHMEVCSRASCSPQYFLPHHAIQRPESSTTKTRVVFDGSCRFSTQPSLNDVLKIGPTVQPALYSIVINFRMPRYAITADLEKMFRQIWIHPEDRRFQQILWRRDPSEPIRTYCLKTVTYGLASSPYHATRVLNQLASEERSRFPLAEPIIRKGTYVDNVIAGHDNHETLKEACAQLIKIFQSAGFVLRQWASNSTTVLSNVPKDLWENSTELEIDQSLAVKTLGLLWFPQQDSFKFKVPALPELNVVTKRVVVSEMSQLFDPLGLLGPVVVMAKMFIQTLWAENMSWDTELSDKHSTWWREYRNDITALRTLEVPRRVLWNISQDYTMHCFCDASKKGYGCAVYVVSPDETSQLQSHLLTSKSRVAPLRGLTIPRLELCAALLGSQLVNNLRINTVFNGPVVFWTDSTIVLHWIKSTSNKWKIFVSNRVAEIQRLTKDHEWRHVTTESNPADLISRGILATKIINEHFWWHGPGFIRTAKELWPQNIIPALSTLDVKEEARLLVSLHVNEVDSSIFERFSELGKIIRTVAYCYRFYTNCMLPSDNRLTRALSPNEYNIALKCLVRLAQRSEFPAEIRIYGRKSNLSKSTAKSPLKNLNLFMDDFGLLRLDGRLRNLNAPFDTRFPILLPVKHTISWMIARSIHLQTLHGGPKLLLATIRQRFWPLQGLQLARRVVRKCITCFRCRPRLSQQIMAPLPSVRITPARVFSHSGMDYCGPFLVRPLSGRGASVKIYVALFVCLVVKAVHLEVVSDLSSAACINAVKRFVARRGRVLQLHCDNATAFVGADRELKALRQEYLRQFRTEEWDNYCSENSITFCFIPARSPHFGGIWEAGIKSFKHHFRRIIGQKSFTMDQLLTIVVQIEAILNSRPLSPISESPDDLSALTPGHFLIGEPLLSIPEPDLTELNTNRLTRLQEMKRSIQDLWRRWSRDYVSQLQQRSKWKRSSTDIRNGQLVLLRQDNSPPLQWPLGRIVETTTGNDGHTRVVVVQTVSGRYKRAVTEVAVLPIDCHEEDTSQ